MASRQWGVMSGVTPGSYVTLPITATPIAVVANDVNMKHDPLILATYYYESGKFMVDGRRINATDNIWGHWIAICIQWGKSSGGVVTWPISFTNASYIVTALKSADHGGGIPNLLTVAANSITIELEWMSYAGGTGIQNTYPTNNINVIGIGH